MPRLAVGIRITTKPCGEFHSFFVLQMVVFRMPRLAMGIYCSSDCALVFKKNVFLVGYGALIKLKE